MMKTKPDPKTPGNVPPQSAAEVDPALRGALLARGREGRLPCALAFEAAADLDRTAADVGEAMDRLGLRIVKCQLGLFGYAPEKKIVRPASALRPEMEAAIRARLENGRLSCRSAWEIARTLNVPKMGVSAACEALAVKIKPCQLGAF
jgi:hypothetical protein